MINLILRLLKLILFFNLLFQAYSIQANMQGLSSIFDLFLDILYMGGFQGYYVSIYVFSTVGLGCASQGSRYGSGEQLYMMRKCIPPLDLAEMYSAKQFCR